MGPVCYSATRRAYCQVSRQADQGARCAGWEDDTSSISPSEQEQMDNIVGV